ncbi:hypothetical protein JCM3774_002678 [Rhodotorula dairenensis]
MIPSRPGRQVEQRKETVQDRLARLRAEHSARDRPRYGSGGVHQPPPSTSRWLEAATNAANAASSEARSTRLPDRRRGTAGPPAPKSWALTIPEGDFGTSSPRRSSRLHPHELETRERIVTPLLPTAATIEPSPQVKGLFTAAGKVVAEDLARGGKDSVLGEYIHYLPLHLRLRLLDVFADWRNGLVLSDDVLRTLLPSVEALERPEPEGRPAVEDDGAGPEPLLHGFDTLHVDQDDAQADWDAYPQSGDTSADEVRRLDLSFSSVSLRTVRAILLREVPEAEKGPLRLGSPHTHAGTSSPSPAAPMPPASPRPPKYVAAFPFLHTLNLSATSRIPYSDGFFDLLSHLISLRTISLAGRSLSIAGSNAHPIGFLARLAAATPTLQVLDLSYSDLNFVSAVNAVDWDERWLDLRVLGLRREYPEEVSAARLRQRLKRDVWNAITVDRRKKRRWIEIVT